MEGLTTFITAATPQRIEILFGQGLYWIRKALKVISATINHMNETVIDSVATISDDHWLLVQQNWRQSASIKRTNAKNANAIQWSFAQESKSPVVNEERMSW